MALWTESDVIALKRAIATGLRRVEFVSGDHRRVQEFQSLADMRKLLADMEAEAAGNAVALARPVRRVASYDPGF